MRRPAGPLSVSPARRRLSRPQFERTVSAAGSLAAGPLALFRGFVDRFIYSVYAH